MTPVAVHQLAHDLYARVTQLQALRTSGITIKEEMERLIAEAVEPLVDTVVELRGKLGSGSEDRATWCEVNELLAKWRSE